MAACREVDVPILKLLRSPCRDGHHGYDCTDRWDLLEEFLPDPARWIGEWNASQRASLHETNCQRAFFDALADRMTRAHWDVEWDAQPFRIAAVPPRTIGKLLHQLITANYYHLTLPVSKKPPLRYCVCRQPLCCATGTGAGTVAGTARVRLLDHQPDRVWLLDHLPARVCLLDHQPARVWLLDRQPARVWLLDRLLIDDTLRSGSD